MSSYQGHVEMSREDEPPSGPQEETYYVMLITVSNLRNVAENDYISCRTVKFKPWNKIILFLYLQFLKVVPDPLKSSGRASTWVGTRQDLGDKEQSLVIKTQEQTPMWCYCLVCVWRGRGVFDRLTRMEYPVVDTEYLDFSKLFV